MVSESQRERLTMLMEECAEVQKEVTKILRYGYDSYHPNEPETTNKTNLEYEIRDLLCLIEVLGTYGDVEVDHENLSEVWSKKLKWTRNQ